MVCDRIFLRANVQSFYFVGYLFGSLVLGFLSDKLVNFIINKSKNSN
jgi:hypothetical protein